MCIRDRIVAVCEKSGVHTKFIPDYNKVIPTKPYTEDLQGLPVINIRRVPLNDPLNAAMKRAIDIFGAIVALILFSPVMLLTAILIKLTSPGPLIYLSLIHICLPDGTLVSPPLEDLSPFLPDEEMDKLMIIPRIKECRL